MRRVIFLFLDGVGLGSDDGQINPLATQTYPTIDRLLGGQPPVLSSGRVSSSLAELIPTDARLGVSGRPQSATGQATILTGVNAAQRLGEHYGPRPDARVRSVVDEGTIFGQLRAQGKQSHFVNAYPHGFFAAVERGKRRLSAVPYAAQASGQRLLNHKDMVAGTALAADFTNRGWREQLGYEDVPIFTPREGGYKLWEIAQPYSFVFFEHWMTDLVGHRQQLPEAVELFQVFDEFLAGLLSVVDLDETLLIVGSDHGNVEDCSHRKHTMNPALTLLIGDQAKRYAPDVQTLTDYAPTILDYLS